MRTTLTVAATVFAATVLGGCGNTRGYVAGSAQYTYVPPPRVVGYCSPCGDRQPQDSSRCYRREYSDGRVEYVWK